MALAWPYTYLAPDSLHRTAPESGLISTALASLWYIIGRVPRYHIQVAVQAVRIVDKARVVTSI